MSRVRPNAVALEAVGAEKNDGLLNWGAGVTSPAFILV
jgi:hypothetical protein